MASLNNPSILQPYGQYHGYTQLVRIDKEVVWSDTTGVPDYTAALILLPKCLSASPGIAYLCKSTGTVLPAVCA